MKMNKLTENSIRKAEIREKHYKIYDGGGMFLLVHTNGSKYWRMKYTFDGKNKLASFGVWPGISLKEARERRQDAKQKIKMGINPTVEMRKNKATQKKQSKIKVNTESLKYNKSSSIPFQWSSLISRHGKMRETEASLKLLKSSIFGSSGENSLSLLDKQERNEILSRIYSNRSELCHIIWEYYHNFPILNIVILFILLLIVIDFIPAVFTIILYFILNVCAAVALCIWEEKNIE